MFLLTLNNFLLFLLANASVEHIPLQTHIVVNIVLTTWCIIFLIFLYGPNRNIKPLHNSSLDQKSKLIILVALSCIEIIAVVLVSVRVHQIRNLYLI